MRTTLVDERSIELDLAELRRRLRAPVAPGLVLASDPGGAADPASLTRASVLIPLVLHEDAMTVLFTQRTAHLRAHSGQISFPGGRQEPEDSGPEATALRESQEEIGLDPRRVELIGRLPEYRTRTGFSITPVIGLLHTPLDLVPDHQEVDSVFEVPMSFLLDPANHLRHSREFQGRMLSFFAMPFGERYIWGATAAMLVNLYRHLAAAGR